MQRRFTTQALVEAGVAIALAIALDRIKLFTMPQGGSVTAGSMIPIFLIAIRHGTGLGLTAGAVFGLVQWMLGGYVVHPLQGLLDYPIAFGFLGLAGLAWPRWAGISAGILGRGVAHVIAGVVYFASFAPAEQSPLMYSIVYNVSYLVPELLLSAAVVYLLLMNPAIRRLLTPQGAPASMH